MAEDDYGILAYKPEAGQIMKYSIIITSSQAVTEKGETHRQVCIIEMVMAQTIKEVNEGESFTCEYCIESGEMKQDGARFPMPGVGEPFVVTMEFNGRVLSSTLELPFSTPTFPDKRLKPGERWHYESSIALPPGIEPQEGQDELLQEYDYEVEGLEEKLGYSCVTVAVVCPERTISFKPDITHTTSGSGKVYFAHCEGKLAGFHNVMVTDLVSKDLHTTLTVATDMELL